MSPSSAVPRSHANPPPPYTPTSPSANTTSRIERFVVVGSIGVSPGFGSHSTWMFTTWPLSLPPAASCSSGMSLA